MPAMELHLPTTANTARSSLFPPTVSSKSLPFVATSALSIVPCPCILVFLLSLFDVLSSIIVSFWIHFAVHSLSSLLVLLSFLHASFATPGIAHPYQFINVDEMTLG
jgi:hypothetical protein